jgi:anaerobic selenocysteine-containing dehydrogenase
VNSWSHNVPALSGGSNRCTLHLHPGDAERLGIAAGEPVRVRGRHGEVVVDVELSADVLPGVVSLPYGWGHGRRGTRLSHAARTPGVSMNALTDDSAVDPLSGTAVFNAVPVEVTAVREP